MTDVATEDSTEPGTVLHAEVSHVLELFHEGRWQTCTANKTDPEDVLRTLDFRESQNPDDLHRIVQVKVMATVVSREDVEKLVPPKEEQSA